MIRETAEIPKADTAAGYKTEGAGQTPGPFYGL